MRLFSCDFCWCDVELHSPKDTQPLKALPSQRRPRFRALPHQPQGISWSLLGNWRGTQQLDNLQDAWNSVPSGFQKCKARVSGSFAVMDGHLQPAHRSIGEANLNSSEACTKRYSDLLAASRQRKKKDILRHKGNNHKLLVHERLRLLLEDEDFLELSPLAGHDLLYGTVQNAGVFTGTGKMWSLAMLTANDATAKGGSLHPLIVNKQRRAQAIAIKNHPAIVYFADNGGAFLPLQADIFPDENHGGRVVYNMTLLSLMKIPQVAVVCGSRIVGAAYVSSLPEESIIVNKIGSMFLAGLALVKAATKEENSVEDLGGAILHSQVSGGVDYLASTEEEAYNQVKNIFLPLDYGYLPEEPVAYDEPLCSPEELNGLASQDFESHLDIKLVRKKR